MTTIYDVARIAGVSTATVSHVINKTKRFSPATTTRVQSAIAQLKFVARPIRRVPARQDTIAISVTSELNAVSESSIVVHSGELPTPGVSPAVYPSQKRDALKPITAASATTRAMLRIVRAAQPISRADLARRLAVRRSTITELVKPLMASGLLREGAPEQMRSRIGRPPVGLSLRDESRFFVGVNIGVRRTQVGAALVDGQILAEESYDTPADSGIALAQVRASIDRLRTSISDRTISAIGVSVPGPTDADRKRLLFAPHLGWRDVEIAKALRLENIARARKSNHEVPIIVENDATAAAMYELRSRLRNSNSREPGDFVLVRAGTGIGVGLVIGGEIYAGSGIDGGLLGEFGHMTIVAGGKSCVCGNRGCWERYASASSAASLYAGDRRHARDSSPLRFVDIVARAAAGERRAQVTLERIGDYLGIGIANIISALGIARIVVSGRIVLGWKFIEGSLHQSVARTMVGRLATWSIQPGEPSGAGLGGALEVVIEQHLNAIVAETRSAA
jgi:predicted NBD/HSP70 family sugar kinase/plasmid maintenance system antidote protein VapI